MSTFIDPDMAYLLGLIVGRGTIREISGMRQLVIEFPFRSLEAKGIKKSFDTRDKILLSLDDTINRLGELTEVTPKKVVSKNSVSIILESTKNSLLWRNINKLLKGKTSFREMEVPETIYDAEEEIKKEFLRGISDVTGSIGTGGRDQAGRHRVYISILNENWKLPIQICRLLQDAPLNIPVNTIDWGHPNIRNGHAKEYNEGREQAWAREHQLKLKYFPRGDYDDGPDALAMAVSTVELTPEIGFVTLTGKDGTSDSKSIRRKTKPITDKWGRTIDDKDFGLCPPEDDTKDEDDDDGKRPFGSLG